MNFNHTHKECVRMFQTPAYIFHMTVYQPQFWGNALLNDSMVLVTLPLFLTVFCRLRKSPAFFEEGFLRKPLTCLCQRTDCQCFSCFLLTHLAPFADIPSTGSGSMTGCAEPSLINQPFHFHQLPCAHKSIKPCHILLVSPGNDNNPRFFWSLSGNYWAT
jgi:hypothetical protein